MPLKPPAPRYVADLFAPLHRELIALLRELTPEQWERPTVAGAWRVRDVAAHMLDGMLRKLSRGSSAQRPLSYEEVVALINELNATGVAYWQRHSPEVLSDLLAQQRAGFEANPQDAKLLVPAALPKEVDVKQFAAWVSVGRVLLNLDEFITRE